MPRSSGYFMIGVYKIMCLSNGRIYIGSSLNFEKRIREHLRDLERGSHKSRHLQRCWDKYGESAFRFYLIERSDKRNVRRIEQFYLDHLQPFGRNGFNNCKQVGTTLGLKLTPEQRRKISAAGRGRKHKPETIEKLRAARLANNHQRGRPLTEKQKTALFRSGKDHPWYGRRHTEETKQLIRRLKSAPVEQVSLVGEVIRVWPSTEEAAAAMGLKTADTIRRSIRYGRRAAGCHWRRVQDRNIIS